MSQTHRRTDDIASPWAPVGAKNISGLIELGTNASQACNFLFAILSVRTSELYGKVFEK